MKGVGRKAVERYVGAFLEQFWTPALKPDADGRFITAAFEAVRDLHEAGHNYVGREQIRDVMNTAGHTPSNLQNQMDHLLRFGVLVPVKRFENVKNYWYVIDEDFVAWLGDVYDAPNDPPSPPTSYENTIASDLGEIIDDGRTPTKLDTLAAWFHAGCISSEYADVEEVESVSFDHIGRPPAEHSTGYLLDPYLRDGDYTDRFREYVLHAELAGTVHIRDRKLFKDDVFNRFETLFAIVLYDGGQFSLKAARSGLDLDENGEMPPERWEKLRYEGAEHVEVKIDVNENEVLASAYRGRFE